MPWSKFSNGNEMICWRFRQVLVGSSTSRPVRMVGPSTRIDNNQGGKWPGKMDPVADATGQSLAHVYCRENANDAQMAKVLKEDEARRIAANIAKLPELLKG